jgi:hypothetical protein
VSAVEIRLMGTPEDVEEVVETLHEHLHVTSVSRPYSCRRDTDRVRIYIWIEHREAGS